MASPSPVLLAGFAVVAFGAGIGITTVGPGGVFVTAVLYAFSPLAPGTIAGTTSTTLFLGGLLGMAVYGRSGELAATPGREIAVLLSVSSALGALLGSQLNALLAGADFGLLLSGFIVVVGALLLYRTHRDVGSIVDLDIATGSGRLALAVVGFGVGVSSGLFGVGGPVFGVPLLVLVGVPLLTAVAAAQVQSVFITGGAATGYLLRGTVDPVLLGVITPPLLAGIAVGWRLAHRISAPRLQRVLGVVLVGLGVFLAAGPR